jgi:hypothetical protein
MNRYTTMKITTFTHMEEPSLMLSMALLMSENTLSVELMRMYRRPRLLNDLMLLPVAHIQVLENMFEII